MSQLHFYSFFVLLFLFEFGNAQSSSGMLLGSGHQKAPQEAGLESGRYQVRKGETEEFIPAKKRVRKQKRRVAVEEPITPDTKVNRAPILPEAAKTEVVPETAQPQVTDHLKDLLQGTPSAAVQAYKEQIHPDDIRNNIIEVEFAPTLLYNNSTSNFSYRSYTSFSPFLDTHAAFWLTPLIGFTAGWGTSFSADISSNGPTKEKITVRHEWTNLGIDFRKFFGMSRKSNSLTFGFHFMDYKLQVPLNELTRMQLKSSGLGVHVEARIPTAPSYAWVFGGLIEPRLAHSETATGIDAQAGSSPESSRVGLNVGGEFKMARQHQLTWKLAISVEKNKFNGTSSVVDPETGVVSTGTSVINSFSFFSLGYRWGQ